MADHDFPYDDFHLVLGQLTHAWAHIELTLDVLTLHVHYYRGDQSSETQVPRSLSRKLKYIKKEFKTDDTLKPWEPQAVELCSRISARSSERHDLVHGVAIGSASDIQIEILKLHYGKLYHSSTRKTITLTEILNNTLAAQDLADEAANLLSSAFANFRRDVRNKALGKGGI